MKSRSRPIPVILLILREIMPKFEKLQKLGKLSFLQTLQFTQTVNREIMFTLVLRIF